MQIKIIITTTNQPTTKKVTAKKKHLKSRTLGIRNHRNCTIYKERKKKRGKKSSDHGPSWLPRVYFVFSLLFPR